MHPYVVRIRKVECRLIQSELKTNAPSCSPPHFLVYNLIQSVSILRVHPYVVLIAIKNAVSCSPPDRNGLTLLIFYYYLGMTYILRPKALLSLKWLIYCQISEETYWYSYLFLRLQMRISLQNNWIRLQESQTRYCQTLLHFPHQVVPYNIVLR